MAPQCKAAFHKRSRRIQRPDPVEKYYLSGPLADEEVAYWAGAGYPSAYEYNGEYVVAPAYLTAPLPPPPPPGSMPSQLPAGGPGSAASPPWGSQPPLSVSIMGPTPSPPSAIALAATAAAYSAQNGTGGGSSGHYGSSSGGGSGGGSYGALAGGHGSDADSDASSLSSAGPEHW